MKKIFPLLFFVLSCQCSLVSQELTMFNGILGTFKYYEDNNKISKTDVSSLMQTNAVAKSNWKKANLYNTLFWTSTGASFGILFYGINSSISGSDSRNILCGIIAAGIVGNIFYFTSLKFRKKAILNYNEKVTSQSLGIGKTENGLGMVLVF